MPIVACLIEDCEREAVNRDWCHKHYEYMRTNGILPPKLCLGCGEPVGPRKRYHSDACKPRCSVAGCNKIVKSRGWCVLHNSRWEVHGDPEADFVREKYTEGQLCAFEGCPTLARKVGYCDSHYNHIRKGHEPRKIVPKSNSYTCAFCGGPSGIISGYRKTCGPNCHTLLRTHGAPLPETWECMLCKESFPYEVEGRRRRPGNMKFCDPCRKRNSKHGYSAKQLAARDGNECNICKKPVDMSLRAPDLMRGSVDHIVPLSRGGKNDPDNVALAHLHCNIKKNNRLDYVAS